MKDLQEIKIDAAKKTVSVGAGVRVGPISAAIGKEGFALPHGEYTEKVEGSRLL